ncbi:TetR/AcrR family transcriptional regulator [Amycolatopsis granulosa]|uniref:TetR/AcrR family transcriptional regulator n=1 Tax=Amycolatopsis granulosa TaxID=185684 RepID=UPI0014231828|nr:helix-turn-helix domain-containing protein [Amycolatopsis granulosa]NIH84482.1 AcrR family transcriptional regulator [Amycolatopsis granulosa]
MTANPRDRMVYSAAQLIRTQGVSGTGMREVVEHASAPRGSLQHYFPGGKDQLVREALAWSGEFAASRVKRYAAAAPTPGGLFAGMVAQWRDQFRDEGYAAGCPLVATTADVVAGNDDLRRAVREGFETWLRPVEESLRDMGVPPERARSLAVVMISALEGAIVMARAQEDPAPLDAVVAELGPVLDAARS